MELKSTILQLRSAIHKAASTTIAGGGGGGGGWPPIDPLIAQRQFLQSLAQLKSRERPVIRATRWSGPLREPIRIPSRDHLDWLYGAVPAADREWCYAYKQRINKLETLRTQLGVETWWEVALWFAKREVPGFKIASKDSKRGLGWSTLRVQLYATVNALMDGHERQPKAVEWAIAKLRKLDPTSFGRYTGATLRKQYYLAKAEALKRK